MIRPLVLGFLAAAAWLCTSGCVLDPRLFGHESKQEQRPAAEGEQAAASGAQAAQAGKATSNTASTRTAGDVANIWVDFGDGALAGGGIAVSAGMLVTAGLLVSLRRRTAAARRLAEAIERGKCAGWTAEEVAQYVRDLGLARDPVEVVIHAAAKAAERNLRGGRARQTPPEPRMPIPPRRS